MNTRYFFSVLISFCTAAFFLPACENGKKKSPSAKFQYKDFKDSLLTISYDTSGDASNIFDSKGFTPGTDSLEPMLIRIDTLWHRELARMQQLDTLIKVMKKGDNYTPEEIATVKQNLLALDSFLSNRTVTSAMPCREKDCPLFAEIIKSSQTLYLYIGGELKDSFKVSTGMKKHETPGMSRRPSGPVFTKYKSRKYPGGNYMGLGNMPYAVFISGGYAIHGTTPGNFSKLGTPASHGCIRLHPYNAKIFYELVKRIGISGTWVTIRDSLPRPVLPETP